MMRGRGWGVQVCPGFKILVIYPYAEPLVPQRFFVGADIVGSDEQKQPILITVKTQSE
jgi:hypothetical protein